MQTWASLLNEKNLMKTATRIAAFERVAGTLAEEEAFTYIEQTLSRYGAKTVRISHPAFISMPVSATLTVAGQSFFCRTHSHAANTEGVRAPLVALDKATMTRKDCEGKIVMIQGRAEREQLIKAGQLGALGVICIAGDVICESSVTPVWGSPDHEELDSTPKTPVVSIDTASSKKLHKLLIDGSDETIITAKIEHGWRDIPLLIAEIAGPVPTENFVMFSGHVDSWYYGATDNGTANAVMMEVCRIAVEQKSSLQRNVRIVFFSGHSQGRYAGSAWYSDNFWEDIEENCMASINADVLGGVGASELSSASMPELRELVSSQVTALTGNTYKPLRYGRFADQSFWGAGVSCALASFSKQPPRKDTDTYPIGGNPALGWWWHTPEDTLDKIDFANFVRDAKIFASVIEQLAVSKVIPLQLSAAAREAEENLLVWQEKAGNLFDISLPLSRARALQEKLKALEARTGRVNPKAHNRLLRKLSRILVRINYTRGNDFKNDLALVQPPMPALRALTELEEADDFTRKAIFVALTRGRTYVAFMLKQALKVVETFEAVETRDS